MMMNDEGGGREGKNYRKFADVICERALIKVYVKRSESLEVLKRALEGRIGQF